MMSVELPSNQSSTDLVYLDPEELAFWENLRDWKWRISNLYYVKNKHGKKVKFVPNWAQQAVLDDLWFFSIILKARQLGITTFFAILYLDQILFNSNKTAAVIAHTDIDTKRIFEKIKFAWDCLPEELKESIGLPKTDSVGELAFPNGSKIFVSRSTRGSSLQFLHISEFAKICAKYPEKAREIVTGAINSVEKGNFVTIESTAEGKEGYFYDWCLKAQQMAQEKRRLTELDFRFFFFPWYKEATYTLDADFPINKDFEEYFSKLETFEHIKLTDGQKRWYVTKRGKNDEDMLREYPSTPEESFSSSVEGSYYGSQMKLVYEQQRIRNVPWDTRYLVDTWWDLGVNDFNVIVFTQSIGNEIRVIDEYHSTGEGLAHYVNFLKTKPYSYGTHTFPHDVNVQNLDAEGKTRRQTLIDLGMLNLRTVERTKDVNDDIEAVRKIFSRFYFNESTTPEAVKSLNNYHKEWDDKLGQFKNSPRHDKSSHYADVFRLIARGIKQFMAEIGGKEKEKITNFF